MKYSDEDYGYEIERQRRLDAQMEQDAKVVIGRDLKDCDKIQKSVHHDPAPHLPFDEDCFKYDHVDAYIAYGLLATVIALLILFGVML